MRKLNVETKPFIGTLKMVEDPSLVKVSTIKQKILEQLPKVELSVTYKHATVIGIALNFQVVMHTEESGFFWVHYADLYKHWRDVYMEKGIDYKTACVHAEKDLNKIRQLFSA